MRHPFSIGTAIAVVTLLAYPMRAAAGQAASAPCDYAHCSLDIVPRLTGLAVARGASEERIATLPFLWPARPAHIFADDSIAWRHAAAASRRRALAALFTDVGGLLAIGGPTHLHGAGRAMTGAGAALVAVSMPIQFAADAELSRAVWSYNRRFASLRPAAAGGANDGM
ncbi:MAG TPA: hypothetical protein VN651_10855 [Gemmatimonadaceae bacterium]|nr:hypothetical protein [Gemmatimonadaceae bacterium]